MGGVEADGRGAEEQSGSESREEENLSDKVLTVGVLWICMTRRCETMQVWLDGLCVGSKHAGLSITLDCTVLMTAGFYSHSF